MKKTEEWTPFQWHCVNCGRIVTALKNSDGDIRAECKRCHTVMVRIIRNSKRDTLKVYTP